MNHDTGERRGYSTEERRGYSTEERRAFVEAGDDQHGAADFDWQRVRESVGLVFFAYRRHRRLSFGILGFVVFISVLAAVFMPKTYMSTFTLLVQKNQVIGDFSGKQPGGSEQPQARGISETILSYENLIKIAKQTKLLERRINDRPPIVRLKDRIVGLIPQKPASEDEKIRQMAYTLEKKIKVVIDPNAGTVTTTAEWNSADASFAIASAAFKNFMDDRYAQEVSVIEDAIAIYEEHLSNERKLLDTALANLIRAREEAFGGPPRVTTTAAGPGAPPRQVVYRPSDADTDLARQLEAKSAALRHAEDARRVSMAEAQKALAELRSTYAPAHPLVLAQERKIEQARTDSPELAQLRKDHAQLLGMVTARAGSRPQQQYAPGPSAGAGGAAAARMQLQLGTDRSLQISEPPPAVQLASTQMAEASRRYLDLQQKIEGARLQLDVAKASFKHGYAVVIPAELPREPSKPTPALLLIGGIVLGLILAGFASAVRDLSSGLFLETWQARRLGLPVLGEVARP